MTEMKLLTILELRALFGFNRFLHMKDKKEKRRYLLLGAVWILLIAMMAFYVGGFVYGLITMGLGEIVPAYLVMISSLLIIAFGLFKAGSTIFGQKGYEMLASMPIRPEAIVVSRFVNMYVEDLLLTLVILLPGIVTFGVCEKPGILLYMTALIGSLFIPVIPLVISMIFGTVIMAAASRMKHKSLVETVLTVAFVIAVLIWSFGVSSKPEETFALSMLIDLAGTIGNMFEQIYPPAVWLGNAMLGRGLGNLLLFVLVSAGIMVVTVWLVGRKYDRIMRRLMTFSAKHDYQIGAMERRSLVKALYVRELKRYFSSSIYVTNTIVGPIMGCIMAGALCFAGLDKIKLAIRLAVPMVKDVTVFLPFVIGGVFCMMTTTSTSISMEGKQFWAILSLPVSAKELFDSKILLNLSLMLPFYLLSEVFLVLAVRPGMLELIWFVTIPALIILFSVVFGITVNIRFHRFDWEQEAAVVKQSASSALGGFGGLFLAAACCAVLFFLPGEYADLAQGVMCAIIITGTILLYRKNNRTRLQEL